MQLNHFTHFECAGGDQPDMTVMAEPTAVQVIEDSLLHMTYHHVCDVPAMYYTILLNLRSFRYPHPNCYKVTPRVRRAACATIARLNSGCTINTDSQSVEEQRNALHTAVGKRRLQLTISPASPLHVNA